MKVKLIADGTSFGTKLLDENGKAIEGLTKVSFVHDARMVPTLTAEIILVSVDIDGKAVIYGPSGKKIAKIIYQDGSEVEYPMAVEDDAT